MSDVSVQGVHKAPFTYFWTPEKCNYELLKMCIRPNKGIFGALDKFKYLPENWGSLGINKNPKQAPIESYPIFQVLIDEIIRIAQTRRLQINRF